MFEKIFLNQKPSIHTSATPLMEIQREALILGNNMSSGVTVPIFGKKFAKMRQWEQLEVSLCINEFQKCNKHIQGVTIQTQLLYSLVTL